MDNVGADAIIMPQDAIKMLSSLLIFKNYYCRFYFTFSLANIEILFSFSRVYLCFMVIIVVT